MTGCQEKETLRGRERRKRWLIAFCVELCSFKEILCGKLALFTIAYEKIDVNLIVVQSTDIELRHV